MDSINLNSSYQIIDTPEGYAEAAVSSNPSLKWIKFVFTDDQPNINKQRIAQSEFGNIIKSGVHMPIKMEASNMDGGHELSTPLGVITALTKQDNKIVGIAALWREERPDDILTLESAFAEGKPLNLSWEVFYEQAEVDDDGVEDLKGTVVRAITFVGNPAYAGRTNVFTMAQTQSTIQEENTLENQKIAELEARVAELEGQLEAATSDLTSKNDEITSATSELEVLRQYKTERETNDAKAETLRVRRGKLVEAGISLSDQDFEARSERILGMDENTFEFYVQDLSVFSKKPDANSGGQGAASISTTTSIPDLTIADKREPVDILRSAISKK
jgi:hypothetical protein